VAQALREAGLTGPIVTRAAGEAQPAVATADSVVEPSNRRVEILLGG
jgi:outer membrane protein OmpA-like peptidoglycan-associated protein